MRTGGDAGTRPLGAIVKAKQILTTAVIAALVCVGIQRYSGKAAGPRFGN